MTDIVHYKLPFWFFGDFAQVLFVKKAIGGMDTINNGGKG
jgi:hypothetical protein